MEKEMDRFAMCVVHRKETNELSKSIDKLTEQIHGNGKPGIKQDMNTLQVQMYFVLSGMSVVIGLLIKQMFF